MLYTTFALAHKAGACTESYRKFAEHKGGVSKWGKDKPFPLTEVLEVNGLADALWALQCCTDDKAARVLSQTFACDCAEHVVWIYEKHYPKDNRVRNCIKITRDYLSGNATMEELNAAWAAGAAARDAGDSAGAAWDSAWAAARDAGDSAWAAARDAGDSAWAAVWAAWDSAWAAWDSAWAAARDAGDSAWAAWDSAGAAWATEREWQKKRLTELLEGK